jgi:DNA-binding HxlR family transcriptional regulator
LVDLLLALTAAVITASAVILGSFLARYRQLVKEAQSSTNLAKDVWDTMNSRFSVMDARIIDVMVKSEVLSSRLGLPKPVTPSPTITPPPASQAPSQQTSPPSQPQAQTQSGPQGAPIQAPERMGTKTEAAVLGLLAAGPKSSADIKTQLNMSREHTARLMKGLFDRGLVVRDDRSKPYVYEITDAGRSHVAS